MHDRKGYLPFDLETRIVLLHAGLKAMIGCFFLTGGLGGCVGIGAARIDGLGQFFGPLKQRLFRRLDVAVKLFMTPLVIATGMNHHGSVHVVLQGHLTAVGTI